MVSVIILVESAHSTTIVVTSGESIQAAINMAGPSDTIEVHSGIYEENLDVHKRISLCGVDTGNGMPIIDALSRGSAIALNADGCGLYGFELKNSSYDMAAGINVMSNKNTIMGNNVNNNAYGIALWNASYNDIKENDVLHNRVSGIGLVNSTYNNISGNVINYNRYGMELRYCSNNNIAGNDAGYNDMVGFSLKNSNSNIITDNEIYSNNVGGIDIWDSLYNTICGNCIKFNKRNGLTLSNCFHNNVTNNTLYNIMHSIFLYSSMNNTIKGNSASSSGFRGSGIYLSKSSYNTVASNTAIGSVSWGNGIHLQSSGNNLIKDNDVKGGQMGSGIAICRCSGNIINKNNATSQFFWGNGIFLSNSKANMIRNNDVCNNGDDGIYIRDSDENTITQNNALCNKIGIILTNGLLQAGCHHNIITYNNASNNKWGIYLSFSSNNVISGNTANKNKKVDILLSDSHLNIVKDNKIKTFKDVITLN